MKENGKVYVVVTTKEVYYRLLNIEGEGCGNEKNVLILFDHHADCM